MNNEIVGVVSLTCVDGDLHISIDVEFVAIGLDSLVADGLDSLVADLVLELHDVANMDFMVEDIFVAGCDHL